MKKPPMNLKKIRKRIHRSFPPFLIWWTRKYWNRLPKWEAAFPLCLSVSSWLYLKWSLLQRAPNREAINGTGSVAITPESPHSEAGHQNHSKGTTSAFFSSWNLGHLAQSPGQFRPNHQRPPHKSLTAKYAPQPPPRPTNSKPTFLCHQPDAHLPRASHPGPSK